MEQENKAIDVPDELSTVMEADGGAKIFFESLSDGYKRGYCNWVGGAKQSATRQTRAAKALVMLQNKQKSLRT
ncbi:MAG: YdeI/OmpD-associated family protein [Defluviitaleaceae bacterium]|nr:YdeI/OmpD-associated family protein [Defluviitaleaceae bacterium]